MIWWDQDIDDEEPEASESVLAKIPDCLRRILQVSVEGREKPFVIGDREKPIVISGNELAQQFILETWGFKVSKRVRYPNLFSTVEKWCQTIFQCYLELGSYHTTSTDVTEWYVYKVEKLKDIRGDLVLKFTLVDE